MEGLQHTLGLIIVPLVFILIIVFGIMQAHSDKAEAAAAAAGEGEGAVEGESVAQ